MSRIEDLTPQKALERLFTQNRIAGRWFTRPFLARVPVGRLKHVLADLRSSLGAFREVRQVEDKYLVVFEHGSVPANLAMEQGTGRIASLVFQPARPSTSSLDEALAGFEALSGQVAVLVVEDGQIRASLKSDTPLAVGSAFKLAVLAALQDQIRAGKCGWRRVVRLRTEWKTLPAGVLYRWPDGAPLTLYTLAALMISQSDNTATDALIHLAGRQAIASVAPRNVPFVTTRDAFVLKDPANYDLLERYRRGDEAERRRVLKAAQARPLPTAGSFAARPTALDVEWYFTAGELCGLMERVADLPLMGINPGLADPDDWSRVAFKGGSDSGVLSLVTRLVSRDGKRYCVAAIWNDETYVDETSFFKLYSGLLEALKQRASITATAQPGDRPRGDGNE